MTTDQIVYSVFGAVEAQKVINRFMDLGQIGNLFSNFYQLKKLEPEYATGIHVSAEWEPNSNNEIQVQFFIPLEFLDIYH